MAAVAAAVVVVAAVAIIGASWQARRNAVAGATLSAARDVVAQAAEDGTRTAVRCLNHPDADGCPALMSADGLLVAPGLFVSAQVESSSTTAHITTVAVRAGAPALTVRAEAMAVLSQDSAFDDGMLPIIVSGTTPRIISTWQIDPQSVQTLSP